MGSFLIVIMGIWLLLFVLKMSEIEPFNKNIANPKGGPTGFFHPSVNYLEADISAWADEFELDPLLVATVIQIETCGNSNAVSPVGAVGLFQVMPYHFLPGDDPLDPQINAQRGLDYLRQSFIKSNGDIRTTLVGYNGGHGQITREPESWPDETKRYVHWGSGIYQDARDNNSVGEALLAWLDAGGWQLCEDANIELGLH